MTASRVVSSSKRWTRQSEAVRRGAALGRGGRVEELPRHVLQEEGGDELGVDPGARKLRVLGRQRIEMQEALQALEDEFDLPAQAVEGEHVAGREALGGKRGDEQHEGGGAQGLLLQRLALLAAL